MTGTYVEVILALNELTFSKILWGSFSYTKKATISTSTDPLVLKREKGTFTKYGISVSGRLRMNFANFRNSHISYYLDREAISRAFVWMYYSTDFDCICSESLSRGAQCHLCRQTYFFSFSVWNQVNSMLQFSHSWVAHAIFCSALCSAKYKKVLQPCTQHIFHL